MTLKFLVGGKMQDIVHRTICHGVSRSTVVQSIRSTLTAILHEFPIDPFPFDDVDRLQEIDDGFKKKSGGLFTYMYTNVVGALAGWIPTYTQNTYRKLRICIGKRSDTQNPMKIFRKSPYVVNCQVSGVL